MGSVFEFRGVRNLVYAEVSLDQDDVFTAGAVTPLAPVAEIGKTTETSSENKYYDNKAQIVISSTGADEITITTSGLELETLAKLTGQYFDSATGMLVEGERDTEKYFAIGYVTKGTDGKERYVWRLKGKFSIPDETNATENDGTDSNNQQLTYTGIDTVHKFTKTNKSARAVVVDERYDKADLSKFFDQVQTPDTVTAKQD